MGVEKLLEKLQKYLDKGEKREIAVRCDRIDSLLDKLGKKEKKLKKKLASEKDKSKRKQLKLELRIVSMERKKGNKRRKELKEKCK
jgi:hypothetical protein